MFSTLSVVLPGRVKDDGNQDGNNKAHKQNVNGREAANDHCKLEVDHRHDEEVTAVLGDAHVEVERG